VQNWPKHGETEILVPFTQYCCAHHCVFGSQLKEQTVPFAIHFFSKAQLPGGGAILPLAEATETLAGNATVIASNATFIIEVICMFIPIHSPVSFYIAGVLPQAIVVFQLSSQPSAYENKSRSRDCAFLLGWTP
jgi:hypothetical protein